MKSQMQDVQKVKDISLPFLEAQAEIAFCQM